MVEADPAEMMYDLKTRVMDALLELSARENEARDADEILLADRIYDARSRLTDGAAVLTSPDALNLDALREAGPVSANALALMGTLDQALPAASQMLSLLEGLRQPPEALSPD